MDLNQIRYFLSLAETLNFTRAAEACNVTQPALTKSIQRLEEELGGLLLLRERSLTQLTPLGRSMLPLLGQSYEAAERAKSHAAGLRRQPTSPLQVGFAPGAPRSLFMPVFEELATKLPGFELSLVEASNAGLCDFLLHGTLDAAVLIGPSALPARLNRWALLTHASTLIMSHGHKLAAADPCSLAMLDGVPVVCRGSDCVLAGLLETAEQRHGARPAVRHRADSAGGVIELVRAGLGVAAWSEVDPVPDGLCTRRLEPPATHAIVLAAVAGRPLGRAPDAFIKLARARDWTGCRERGHGIAAPFRQHALAATG